MSKEKSKGGRPTDYTPELGDKICQGIAEKTPLARLCSENDDLPHPATVYRWLRLYPEFCDNYTRAKEDQADYLAEECLDISDDSTLEPADKRIRVDTRKWLASKFQPKKYGDRVVNEHTGTVNLTNLSDDELEAKAREAEQALKQSTQD